MYEVWLNKYFLNLFYFIFSEIYIEIESVFEKWIVPVLNTITSYNISVLV